MQMQIAEQWRDAMPFDGLGESPEAKLLIAARDRIGAQIRWCKGLLSHDGQWCTVGAICATADNLRSELIELLATELPTWAPVADCAEDSVTGFNDDARTTHADVMAVFDRAISRARLQGYRSPSGSSNSGAARQMFAGTPVR
jgi:hypothetical protein